MKKFLLSTALLFFIGCGGNGSSENSNVVLKGKFLDAPVKNLSYTTSSGISGVTDENGSFYYKKGDSIVFKLGDAFLGEVKGKETITPYDFFNEKSEIAYVLQNLDTDGNLKNGIDLPDEDILKTVITTSDVSNLDLYTLKNTLSFLRNNYRFLNISENEALTNLNDYLAFISNDKLIRDVLTKGLVALKGKMVYFAYKEDFLINNRGTIGFYDNNWLVEFDDGRVKDIKVLSWNKNYVKTSSEGEITNFILNIDIKNHLIFLFNDDGEIVISSSKKAIDRYIEKLNNTFQKIPVNPKMLKDIYLYGLDDNSYNWYAISLGESNLNLYYVDDILNLNDINNYKFLNSKWIEYLGGNKFKIENDEDEENNSDIEYIYDNYYYEENNTYTYYQSENVEDFTRVFAYPLAKKSVDIFTIGAALDSMKVFPYLFTKFGISSIYFKKGRFYCDLLWDECWMDKDAMNEITSNILNVNYLYALKKGVSLPPRYTKLSDYLKEKKYYVVYTDFDYVDYESWSRRGDKFVWKEIESSDETPDSGEEDMLKIDNLTKILAEYENGILIEVNDSGKNYKIFLYNNKNDAERVYGILLKKY